MKTKIIKSLYQCEISLILTLGLIFLVSNPCSFAESHSSGSYVVYPFAEVQTPASLGVGGVVNIGNYRVYQEAPHHVTKLWYGKLAQGSRPVAPRVGESSAERVIVGPTGNHPCARLAGLYMMPLDDTSRPINHTELKISPNCDIIITPAVVIPFMGKRKVLFEDRIRTTQNGDLYLNGLFEVRPGCKGFAQLSIQPQFLITGTIIDLGIRWQQKFETNTCRATSMTKFTFDRFGSVAQAFEP